MREVVLWIGKGDGAAVADGEVGYVCWESYGTLGFVGEEVDGLGGVHGGDLEDFG